MRLGPVLGATVVVPELAPAIAAFGKLGLCVRQASTLARARALALGRAELAEAPGVLLGAAGEAPWLAVCANNDPTVATGEACGWNGLSLPMDDEAWRALRGASGTEERGDLPGCLGFADVPGFFLARSSGAHRGAWLRVPDPVAARAFYAGLGLAPLAAQPGTRGTGQLAGGGLLHFVDGGERPSGVDQPYGMLLLTLARVDSQGKRLAGVTSRLIGGAIGERLELI